jgi:hypothetical protein
MYFSDLRPNLDSKSALIEILDQVSGSNHVYSAQGSSHSGTESKIAPRERIRSHLGGDWGSKSTIYTDFAV